MQVKKTAICGSDDPGRHFMLIVIASVLYVDLWFWGLGYSLVGLTYGFQL